MRVSVVSASSTDRSGSVGATVSLKEYIKQVLKSKCFECAEVFRVFRI